jgi:hypothetical protein
MWMWTVFDDVSEVHAAFIFRVEVRMGVFFWYVWVSGAVATVNRRIYQNGPFTGNRAHQ